MAPPNRQQGRQHMDMDWKIELGRTAVNAHVDAISNGQETEPFETQALDAITDILHALYVDFDGEGDFDADRFLNMALIHYNTEQAEADED